MNKQPLKASELVTILQEEIKTHGDGVVVYNVEGSLYSIGRVKSKTTKEYDGNQKWVMLLPPMFPVEY